MPEHHPDFLLPRRKFVIRIIRNIFVGFICIAAALGLGMEGYHYYEQMNWVDAFVNASMILSGMGPVDPLKTTGGRIFAGMYALFSGLAFILIIGIIFAPAIHRMFTRFHLELQEREKKTDRWRFMPSKSEDKQPPQMDEQKQRQVDLIHRLAVRLPWIVVIVTLIAAFFTIVEVFLTR